jgi:hypothetical protein
MVANLPTSKRQSYSTLSSLVAFFLPIVFASLTQSSLAKSISTNSDFLPPVTRVARVTMIRLFPSEKYRKFPGAIRSLLQRQEYEQDVCRSSSGENGERQVAVMIACNRAERALFLLEVRGWCWGGGAIAAEDMWLPCARLPRRRHASFTYSGDPFSAQDIRDAQRGDARSADAKNHDRRQ